VKLEKIILNNFGVYQDNVSISLPQNTDKNICLVDGNNGFGKTTILNAVEYCLFGIKEKYAERLDYINKNVLNSKKPHMSVELKFSHDDKSYSLKRSVEPINDYVETHSDIEEKVELIEDGIEVQNVENRINEILPMEN